MTSQGSEGQRRATRPEEDDVEVALPADSAQRDALDANVDAILDEIDEVLEENAEEFVKNYVQKGGE